MENQKFLEFNGTAGGYFLVFLVTMIGSYIPILGWAFAFNYTSEWMADYTLVGGRKIKFEASYVESLKFIFINTLLLIVTLGIYTFWFVPKSYRYVMDHIHYADGLPATPAASQPVQPVVPAGPVVPQPSTDVDSNPVVIAPAPSEQVTAAPEDTASSVPPASQTEEPSSNQEPPVAPTPPAQ